MTDQYHLVVIKPREPSMVLTWDPVSKPEAVRLRDKYRTSGELLLIVPEPECDQ